MELHRIAEDLDEHAWYVELVERTVAQAEAFNARWANFEQAVAAVGENDRD